MYSISEKDLAVDVSFRMKEAGRVVLKRYVDGQGLSKIVAEVYQAMRKYEATVPPVGDEMMDTKELAMRWSMDYQYLINMRNKGRGPTYYKLGTGAVKYKVADIIAYEDYAKTIPPRQNSVIKAVAVQEQEK